MMYRTGYKYQLVGTWGVPADFPFTAMNAYIEVKPTGIIIKDGYAWDGPSGPVVDTPKKMRASLVHDALYQLIREGLVDPEHKDFADRLFMSMCIEDGLATWRAYLYYKALKAFGKPATRPENGHRIVNIEFGKIIT